MGPNEELLQEWMLVRVFVPMAAVAQIRAALDDSSRPCSVGESVGSLGNYDTVRYEIPVFEHFLPKPKAEPYCEIPPPGVCVETWCSLNMVEAVVHKLREEHPYEHPVIEASKVLLVNPKQKTKEESP